MNEYCVQIIRSNTFHINRFLLISFSLNIIQNLFHFLRNYERLLLRHSNLKWIDSLHKKTIAKDEVVYRNNNLHVINSSEIYTISK